jgi:hypothetical protein
MARVQARSVDRDHGEMALVVLRALEVTERVPAGFPSDFNQYLHVILIGDT